MNEINNKINEQNSWYQTMKEQHKPIERLGKKMGIQTVSRQNREMRKFVVGIVRNTDMDPSTSA